MNRIVNPTRLATAILVEHHEYTIYVYKALLPIK